MNSDGDFGYWSFKYVVAVPGLTTYTWERPWIFGTHVALFELPRHQQLAYAAGWRLAFSKGAGRG